MRWIQTGCRAVMTAPVAVWRAIIWLGVLNGLSCLVVYQFIGGDAVNGCRADGHYFLNDHGRLTETSRAVWIYSCVHIYSNFITSPLIGLASFMLAKDDRERSHRQMR